MGGLNYQTGGSAGIAGDLRFDVLVDGSLIRRFTLKSSPGANYGSGVVVIWNQVFTLEAVIESLTPGSHTFSIKNVESFTIDIIPGFIRVQDMYR